MERDPAYLLDILEASKVALSYIQDVTEESFNDRTQLQDAVIRRIEIIGEAARRVSAKTQNAHPDLPWHEMIGMRNLLIHDYDGIDLGMVWQTVKKDLPRLIEAIQKIISSDDNG